MQEGKYNIKAVSKMLDIMPGTLRAWERRYKVIAPVRNESGHRLYTDQHVKTLKWLIAKVNQGFTISQAIALLDRDDTKEESDDHPDEGPQEKNLGDELLQALLSFDETKAHGIINQAFGMYTIEQAVVNILGSLLVQIGDMWEKGEITSAHEHFASSVLRSRISFIMHTLPVNSMLPKVITVCAPGEWHEFGLLIFSLFLKRKGYQTVYLGPSIAEKDLFVVLDIIKPKGLFFSCTMTDCLNPALGLIGELKKQFPDLAVGIGGAAVDASSPAVLKKYKDCLVGNSRAEWENWLDASIQTS
ncbi:MerR family transcriptional regulator [Actinomycetes bacterium NPDC127524]